MGSSNFPQIYLQNDSYFNTLINLQKVLDPESSVIRNDERTKKTRVKKLNPIKM